MVFTRALSRDGSPHGDASLPDVLKRLFPQESQTPVYFRPRTYVFHQGTDVEAVYLPVQGSLVLERIDEDGRMAMFGMQKAGSLLAWQDLMDGNVHRNSCQTLTACDLVVIPAGKFETTLHENEALLICLMQQAAAQANSYEEHIFRLSTLDVPDRLYWTLLTLAGAPEGEEDEIEVSTPLMKRDLAAMVGTSPESISRSLRRLEKMKVAEFTARNTFKITPPRRA